MCNHEKINVRISIFCWFSEEGNCLLDVKKRSKTQKTNKNIEVFLLDVNCPNNLATLLPVSRINT